MSTRGEVHSDTLSAVEVLELLRSEICSIIRDNVVRDTKSEYDSLHKFDCCFAITLLDQFSLDPFGEFIDYDQEMSETSLGSF